MNYIHMCCIVERQNVSKIFGDGKSDNQMNNVNKNKERSEMLGVCIGVHAY